MDTYLIIYIAITNTINLLIYMRGWLSDER